MRILPFDAHNHVHMGPTRPLVAMLRHGSSDINNSNSNSNSNSFSSSVALGGMALMSTHPRDYPKVLDLCYHTLPQQINELYYSTTTITSTTTLQEDGSRTTTPPPPIFIPCLGVHPWFVNDLTKEDWQLVDHNHTTYYNDYYKDDGRTREREEKEEEENINSGTPSSLHHHQVPRWIQQLEEHLLIDPPTSPFTTGIFESLPQGKTTPPAVAAETASPPPQLRPPPPPPKTAVGEIGLDKFQFHPTTKELRCPMDIQIQAFYYQFELATRLERPVSLHCVHAMGPMVQVIRDVQRSYQKLPPKMYFHAFGGKEATVDQLVALVDKANKKNTNSNKRKAQAKKDQQKRRMQEEEEKKKNASSIEKEDVESLLLSASVYHPSSSSSSASTSKSTALPSARSTTTSTSAAAATTPPPPPTKLYFGFAPVINFRSPKTANVIQKVGLDRLVLETDHEDATFVPEAMILGIDLLSKVFNVPPEQVIAQTTANAMELYGIILPSSSSSDSDSSSSTS
jgi:Tat protein secretion system quality control protein TatD with DNase activity